MVKRRMNVEHNKNNNIVILIIFILIVVFINLGMNFKEKTIPVYSYKVQKSDNYEIILKPNDFYQTETLPSGGYYASNSIQAIVMNLKYIFKGNSKANIDYNYNITANLIGTVEGSNNQDKEVWNRSTVALEGNDELNNEDEFSISEQVSINYEEYNKLTRSYEKEYGIAINAVLKIRLNISYNINNLGTENDYIQIDIPITNTVTEVKQDYEDETVKDINPTIENIQVGKIIFYIIATILIIIDIVLIVLRLYKNRKSRTPETMYNKNISHIFKYYRDLIVTVSNEPNLEGLKIMNVAIMEDLIDVAEQNKSSIIHYEITQNEKSKFYVIVGKYVYVYTVTANKLK